MKFNLDAEGYQTEVVDTGEAALGCVSDAEREFDLIVLDVMLPGIDGFEVITQIRSQGKLLPVLMLTARSHPQDVVKGLSAGADDYLSKPFDLAVLLARIQGLLRRTRWVREVRERERPGMAYTFGGIAIDFDAMQISRGGVNYPLTAMEASLLRYLMDREGQAVSRKSLLEDVWGVHEDTDTRAIDNFIVRLRRYLEDDPSRPACLLTVRGIGYRLVLPTNQP
ncbi:MAG: response regulator transcription factor [Steroidobacteraceae bacterium]